MVFTPAPFALPSLIPVPAGEPLTVQVPQHLSTLVCFQARSKGRQVSDS